MMWLVVTFFIVWVALTGVESAVRSSWSFSRTATYSYPKGSFSAANLKMSSSASSDVQQTDKKRQRWEFGRFLKTAAFYDSLTPRLPFMGSRLSKDRIVLSPGSFLWNAKNNSMGLEWGPLDDVVMGGVSKSDLSFGQRFTGVWNGFVTSANNGGFVGIRTKLFRKPFDLSRCKGIILKVKGGDGNRFKFLARDDDDWNGIAWSYSFDTDRNANSYKEIKIPFDQLRPTKYARTVSGGKKYNKAQMTVIQITLSKFEYDGALNPKFTEGAFQLEIESIKTF